MKYRLFICNENMFKILYFNTILIQTQQCVHGELVTGLHQLDD